MSTTRSAAFLKVVAFLSAVWTLLLAEAILGWQLVGWVLTGEWSPFSVSMALALAGDDRPLRLALAAAVPSSLDVQGITEQLLELPASGVLLVVAAILIGLSIAAASIEAASIEKESAQDQKSDSKAPI